MLEEILSRLSGWTLAGIAMVLYAIWAVARGLQAERRIKALGGHAPVRKTYLPFGVDFVFSLVQSSIPYVAMQFWQRQFETVGRHTFEVNLGGERVIVTEDPENIKAILATQFHDFGKGEVFHRDWHEFLGDSIFNTDGDLWHQSRQLFRPQFVRDRVSDLKTFERHVVTLLEKMAGDGSAVDVKDLFFRYTLDTISDFLLGESVGSLEDPQSAFAEAFGEVQRMQNIFQMTGALNPLLPRGTFRRHLRTMDDFFVPVIERALLLSPEELEKKTKSDEGYTFLHAMASSTRDRRKLRDHLVAALIAGRDTSAGTLSWTFHHLSRDPAIYDRLRQETLEQVGEERQPTYEDLKSLRYLQSVMNETLRLYPAVPINLRAALRDTSLPRGGGPDGLSPVGILQGAQVFYMPITLHRRPDLAPPPTAAFPDVSTFHPERWSAWTPKAWTNIPFNGGPRICVGQQFALTEMAYTIVRILQRFERIESAAPAADVRLKMEIVLQPSRDVPVRFFARASSA